MFGKIINAKYGKSHQFRSMQLNMPGVEQKIVFRPHQAKIINQIVLTFGFNKHICFIQSVYN